MGREGATRVIGELDRIDPHLTTPAQEVHSVAIRAVAEDTRDNHDLACALLRKVEQKALQTRYARRVRDGLNTCPPSP
jgi:hypothetical protein